MLDRVCNMKQRTMAFSQKFLHPWGQQSLLSHVEVSGSRSYGTWPSILQFPVYFYIAVSSGPRSQEKYSTSCGKVSDKLGNDDDDHLTELKHSQFCSGHHPTTTPRSHYTVSSNHEAQYSSSSLKLCSRWPESLSSSKESGFHFSTKSLTSTHEFLWHAWTWSLGSICIIDLHRRLHPCIARVFSGPETRTMARGTYPSSHACTQTNKSSLRIEKGHQTSYWPCRVSWKWVHDPITIGC